VSLKQCGSAPLTDIYDCYGNIEMRRKVETYFAPKHDEGELGIEMLESNA
jgi:hypothetical protein